MHNQLAGLKNSLVLSASMFAHYSRHRKAVGQVKSNEGRLGWEDNIYCVSRKIKDLYLYPTRESRRVKRLFSTDPLLAPKEILQKVYITSSPKGTSSPKSAYNLKVFLKLSWKSKHRLNFRLRISD